jgi:hypothetical protein
MNKAVVMLLVGCGSGAKRTQRLPDDISYTRCSRARTNPNESREHWHMLMTAPPP